MFLFALDKGSFAYSTNKQALIFFLPTATSLNYIFPDDNARAYAPFTSCAPWNRRISRFRKSIHRFLSPSRNFLKIFANFQKFRVSCFWSPSREIVFEFFENFIYFAIKCNQFYVLILSGQLFRTVETSRIPLHPYIVHPVYFIYTKFRLSGNL